MRCLTASPKLLMAFGHLVKDEKLIKQTEWVRQQIETKALKEREKELTEKKKDIIAEQKMLYEQLKNLGLNEEKWLANIGKEEFEKRKARCTQRGSFFF